jgi:NADH-quinone oxidoreductase subunit L
MLVITAGMTAFYSFRQIFLSFHGEDRHTPLGFHPHEMYKFVLVAMSPLAVLAVITGWFMGGYKEFIYKIGEGVQYNMSEHTHHLATYLGLIVIFFAVSGIVLAYLKYARTGEHAWKRDEAKEEGFFYKLLKNQYYVPKFYEEFITKPYAIISEVFWTKVDLKIVDATVDNIAKFLYSAGDKTRSMQTGNLSNYLNWMAIGGVLLLVIAAISAMIA